MRYGNWIFDLDGTLADTAPDILGCLAEAIRAAGIDPVPPLDVGIIGPPVREMLARLKLNANPERIETIVAAFRGLYDTNPMTRTALYPGILDALEGARREGVRVFVATNKPEKPTARILDLLVPGLVEDFVCGNSESGAQLDKKAMLARLISRHGLEPGGTVMVGDGASDISGAIANGCAAVGVLYGYGNRKDLERAGCAVFIEHSERLFSSIIES